MILQLCKVGIYLHSFVYNYSYINFVKIVDQSLKFLHANT